MDWNSSGHAMSDTLFDNPDAPVLNECIFQWIQWHFDGNLSQCRQWQTGNTSERFLYQWKTVTEHCKPVYIVVSGSII